VHKSNWMHLGTAVVAAAAFCAALPGCSESSARQANRELQQAIDEAQTKLGAALAVMGAPEESEGLSGSPAGLNPEVLSILDEAGSNLSSALRSNVGAAKGLRSLGAAVLGRIRSLEGDYHAAAASEAITSVRQGLDLVERSVFVLQTQGGLVGYYSRVGGLSPQELEESKAKAEQDIRDIRAQKEKLDEKLAALKDEYDRLLEQNRRLITEAQELRRKVSDSTGLDVLEEALAAEAKIDENGAKLARIERDIKAINDQKKEMDVVLKASQKMLASLDEALKLHEQEARQQARQREDVVRQLEEGVDSVERQLAEVVKQYRQVENAQEAALEAYEEAAEAAEGASQLGDDPARPAQAGQIALAEAELYAQEYLLGDYSQRAGELLSRAFTQLRRPLPSGAGAVGNYGRNASEAQSKAVEAYEEAAKYYQLAVSAARRARTGLAGEYQGQLAAAYIGRYRVQPDAETLSKARELLEEAQQGQDDQALLGSMAQLERILERQVAEQQP